MTSIEELLRQRFSTAMGLAFGAENITDPLIKSADPRHADFQSNVAMPLAKRVGQSPREVAAALVNNLNVDDVCEPPQIAGPGFINLRLKREFVVRALGEAFAVGEADRAGVATTAHPQTVVIDYSGPNVAKQMHVGHLRSTIIGDTLARTFEFLGHQVVRQNHIGDFGTQFGMIIHHLRMIGAADAGNALTIEDLDRYYKEATEKFKADGAFAEQARKTVVELQSGQAEAVALWNRMRAETHRHYTEVYKLLNVTLTDADERGESFYGVRLPRIVDRVKQTLEFGGEGSEVAELAGTAAETVEDLIGHEPPDANGLPETQDAGHRVEEASEPRVIHKAFAAYSHGAFCVFLPGYVGKDKQPLPMMIQKRDGGYPYSATDLAALYFRVQEHKETAEEQKPLTGDWHADRVVYLVDARQSQHFAMLFDTFRAAQWDIHPHTHHKVALEHAPFGKMLGQDNRPFKTRSGDTPKLRDLLTEAIERAGQVDAARGAELSAEKRAEVNRAVGIGAVKYADLRQDRTTDYIFDWDRMLSLEGNTGPYLQMQYTRIQSIYRKGGTTPAAVRAAKAALLLDHENEMALAKKLLSFPAVVEAVARDLKPHLLCTYLYELAGAFSRFFESCPVLKAETEGLKLSRLRLCDMAATTLRIGLEKLLGIQVLDEM
ncbi:MAG TPA: arginine--tRNA ligase [Phycisphaerae bacterium]|nr:arginine--tRNA ligase [Phycisphaerae bacterium]